MLEFGLGVFAVIECKGISGDFLLSLIKLEASLGVTNTGVFRSWLVFFLWCALRDKEQLVLPVAKSALWEECLEQPDPVERHCLDLVPLLDAWCRERGRFARLFQHPLFPSLLDDLVQLFGIF
jgi:hypothetical protein